MFLGLEILSIAVYVLAGHAPAPAAQSQEAASSTSCSARSRRPSSSTASPWSTAPPASTNLTKISATSWPTNVPLTDNGAAARRVRPAARRASASRSRRCRSTRGRPTSTRARPRPVVALHGSGVKAAGFAGLLRVLRRRLRHATALDWQPIVYALAVRTLLVGAVLAVVQTNVKRMLAYSSISHAGFILVGVQAAHRRRARRRCSSTWPPTRSWSPARSA